MRHRKASAKIGRTTAHKRCLMANLLKALLLHERIVTTVCKGKQLKSWADQMITLAKENNLPARRRAIARLMVRYNKLDAKQMRLAKSGNTADYNGDRQVIAKLFGTLGPRFANRSGGYTRLLKYSRRVGDNGETCVLELLTE